MFNTATSHQMLQYPAKPMEGRSPNNIWKPSNGATEIAPNCPRCASPNTKFCYYNNYSLSQPRYFCKGCRRYWTKGGSLRNVPVGGGCRKARRSRSSAKPERMRFDHKANDVTSPNGAVDDGRHGMADIDMAEVFAKFLNHNEDQHKGGCADDSSSGASYGSAETETGHARLESCDFPSDYLIIEGAQFQNELILPQLFVGEDQYEEDNIIQDFMTSQHPNLVELHELLNEDDLPQTMSTGFGWQQDFAYDVDQLAKIGATTDDAINWSSAPLDILPSGYGNYF